MNFNIIFIQIFHVNEHTTFTAQQSKKVVSAYLTSKDTLPFSSLFPNIANCLHNTENQNSVAI